MMIREISVVAPITLMEEADDTSWRSNVNSCPELRIRIMLTSFFSRFNSSHLTDFVIVSPERDVHLIQHILSDTGLRNQVTIITEATFFKYVKMELPSTDRCGWYIQQVIKLAFSRICQSTFYLTMDSDIITAPGCNFGDLFPDATRASVGSETFSDYNEIYTNAFAIHETKIKNGYYATANEIFEEISCVSHAYVDRGYFFSETPVLMSSDAVNGLLNRIESHSGLNAAEYLLSKTGWTEQSLYFTWLELNCVIDALHIIGGRNSVLCLDASVWHATEFYRGSRNYPGGFFLNPYTKFVAVQSWVPVSKWLPSRYSNLGDFYADVQALLGLSS